MTNGQRVGPWVYSGSDGGVLTHERAGFCLYVGTLRDPVEAWAVGAFVRSEKWATPNDVSSLVEAFKLLGIEVARSPKRRR